MFKGNCCEKQKELGTSYQSLLRSNNIFRSFLYFVDFPKIRINNLCKPFHNVIIIPFSTFS